MFRSAPVAITKQSHDQFWSKRCDFFFFCYLSRQNEICHEFRNRKLKTFIDDRLWLRFWGKQSIFESTVLETIETDFPVTIVASKNAPNEKKKNAAAILSFTGLRWRSRENCPSNQLLRLNERWLKRTNVAIIQWQCIYVHDHHYQIHLHSLAHCPRKSLNQPMFR